MSAEFEQPAERRGARRIRLRQPMHISVDSRRWVAFCLDLSISGIGAWSSEALDPGSKINATFKHHDEEFDVRAEVVRCEETRPARLGLRITEIHPKLFTLLETN